MRVVDRRRGSARVVFLVAMVSLLAMGNGCSHLSNEDRYPAQTQVIELDKCAAKLQSLRLFEAALFKVGFLRNPVQDVSPESFEIASALVGTEPRFVEFKKSDFEAEKGTSRPYREIVNRYRIAACEEPAGKLYLIVVRHDPVTGDQFLGARFMAALRAASCEVASPIGRPRELGFYGEAAEKDALRYVKRQRCRDYGVNR